MEGSSTLSAHEMRKRHMVCCTINCALGRARRFILMLNPQSHVRSVTNPMSVFFLQRAQF